jgi:hypothetical protein
VLFSYASTNQSTPFRQLSRALCAKINLMSDLTNSEKRKLERAFGMASGYVLNFSNRTLEEFVLDSVGIEIYDEKYDYGSGSKANRIRAFWDQEPNHVVGKLLADIFDEWEEWTQKSYNSNTGQNESQRFPKDCIKVVERLKSHSPVPEVEALKPNSDDKDFEALARAVKDYIKKNEPETGLDRLHTFVVKYVRTLCSSYGVTAQREKPLHSLFGEYVKAVRLDGGFETEMTERILKSTISILDAFNGVRNEHSQAHDNKVVSYKEASLIFNNVVNLIRFLDEFEASKAKEAKREAAFETDIPF